MVGGVLGGLRPHVGHGRAGVGSKVVGVATPSRRASPIGRIRATQRPAEKGLPVSDASPRPGQRPQPCGAFLVKLPGHEAHKP
jgi:hypothetical protein